MRGTSSKEEVIKAGEQALVCLYNGQVGEDVNKLKLHRFYDKTMPSTATGQPHTLLPTANATKYLSFRVFHQIRHGRMKGLIYLILAERLGWKVSHGKMMPSWQTFPQHLKICLSSSDVSANQDAKQCTASVARMEWTVLWLVQSADGSVLTQLCW
jgi:hypothetical protein